MVSNNSSTSFTDEEGLNFQYQFSDDKDATAAFDYSASESASRKKRGKGKTYRAIRTFSDPASAFEYIKDDWMYDYTRHGVKGNSIFYHCKKSSKCPARLCLFYNAVNDEVTVKTAEQHDHSHARTRGISPEIKAEIAILYELGHETASLIRDALLAKHNIDLDKTK
jgi:hypothetical protein